MKVKFIKAYNGDSIHISFLDDKEIKRNILIDGGIGKTYQFKNKNGKSETGELHSLINEIRKKGERIDLLVLTHIDDDHIGGLLKWFSLDPDAFNLVEEVWFNSAAVIAEHFREIKLSESELKSRLLEGYTPMSNKASVEQGKSFEEYLEENKIWSKKLISCEEEKPIIKYGLEFTILSPGMDALKKLQIKWEVEKTDNKASGKADDYAMSLKEHCENDIFIEDSAVPNGSSIAFIITYKSKNLIFLGDAHPSTIVNSLRQLGYSKEMPIRAELIKVAHHGSKANNSRELLEMIDTRKYIISSNGDIYKLPNKRFLARLIAVNEYSEIYFNYEDIYKIFSDQDRKEYPNFKDYYNVQEFEI